MENLRDRLSALQEDLLTLYETGSADIASQIQHWHLQRQENVLYYFARNHGIYRLGYQTIPNLQVAQIKAKEAIEMELTLKSLQKSKYGSEPWTLTDTSRELYKAAPSDTFKKEGFTVELKFDGDPNNVMAYTAWGYIYVQTDDNWEKVKGHVDYDGLYYEHDGYRHYYVQFAQEAAKFGATGQWEVQYKNVLLSSPVDSVSSTSDGYPGSYPDSATQELSKQHSVSLDHTPASSRRRRGRVDTRRQRQRKLRASSSHGATRRRVRGEEEEEGRPEEGGGQREPEPAFGGRRGTPSAELPSNSARQVEARPGRRQRRSRLEALLENAADPPVLVLRGGPNQLKCVRYRLLQRHAHLFEAVSKTWSWLGVRGQANSKGRIIIAFTSDNQRNLFLETVSFPRDVTWFFGNFSSL